jgi:hypothetical protein
MCMTAFSLRSSKRPESMIRPEASHPTLAGGCGHRDRVGRAGLRALVLVSLVLLGLLGPPAPARAEDRVVVSQAVAHVRRGADAGTFVDAQFDFSLPGPLREAVEHGIPLYFSVDLEILRSRWYWFDKRVVGESLVYRLSYSPLTRQFRLARGGLAQPFDSLEQALANMRRVHEWRVADAGALDPENLHGRIRLRLDTSMLPKPFQFNAITDRDWAIGSDWTQLQLPGDPLN